MSEIGRYDDCTMSAAVSVSMRVIEKPRRLKRADGETKRTPKARVVKSVLIMQIFITSAGRETRVSIR